MDSAQLAEFERNINNHYSAVDQQTKEASLKYLDAFSVRQDIIQKCQEILTVSKNEYALIYAIKTLGNAIKNRWMVIDQETKSSASLNLNIFIS